MGRPKRHAHPVALRHGQEGSENHDTVFNTCFFPTAGADPNIADGTLWHQASPRAPAPPALHCGKDSLPPLWGRRCEEKQKKRAPPTPQWDRSAGHFFDLCEPFIGTSVVQPQGFSAQATGAALTRGFARCPA